MALRIGLGMVLSVEVVGVAAAQLDRPRHLLRAAVEHALDVLDPLVERWSGLRGKSVWSIWMC